MSTIAEILARAKALHRAGQLADARALYEQIRAADSTHAEAHYLLGAACHGLGMPEEAIVSLARAIELQPGHPEAHNHLGAVLAGEGRLPEAVASIEQAVRLRPDAGEFAENLRVVSAAMEESLASDLAAQGKLDEAAARFERALELRPDFAEAHNGLGSVREKQEKFAEAAACCQRAIDLNPAFAEAHYNLGVVWQRQGRADEAISCYRQALELKPGLAEASNNLGLLLAQQYSRAQADQAAQAARRSGFKKLLELVTGRLFSAGERAALNTLRTERAIARNHRRGLRQIRREQLSRPTRLNLGCGDFRRAGFLNVDLFPGGDLTLDLRLGLPFESDCCQLIFSEHCFEHFEYPEPITHLLGECYRVLGGGGLLQFSVPDSEWPLRDYAAGPEAPYFKACQQYRWHPAYCTTPLEHINYHFRQGAEHRYAYDFATAEKLLRIAGFCDIQPRAYDPALDSEHRRVGSLFVSARKPA